jgi:hypothetical protein
MRNKRALILAMISGLIVALAIAIGVVLIEHGGSSETPHRVAVLNPVEPGDLAAVKLWAELKCRGRTIGQLSEVYGVEPTMEAVVQRVIRGIPRQSRDAAAKLCEREVRRSETPGAESASS